MVDQKIENSLQVGAVEVDITPPVGVALAGYGARTKNSTGIHDPLKVQALFIQSGANKLLLFTCDLIGIELSITAQIRQEIAQELDISPSNILISCSHTHSGPQGFLPNEPLHLSLKDEELVKITQRKLLGAAIWAVSKKEPASLFFGDQQLTGIGKNRNNPDEGPQDTQLSVLRFINRHGDPIAVLFNYGCHPTVMGHDNLLITADFPGAARQGLKAHFPNCVFMFANGACGDVSTRFTRREQSFAEVERHGLLLAGGVLEAMMKSEQVEVERVGAECVDVQFPQRDLPSPEEIDATLTRLQKKLDDLKVRSAPHGDIRKVITQLEGAHAQLEMANLDLDPSFFKTQLQFLQIGPVFMAAIPGEPFSQTVLDIKSACSPVKTFVISHANDSKGYFPDQHTIDQGTYEALISPYDRRVPDLIFQTAVDHCHKE